MARALCSSTSESQRPRSNFTKSPPTRSPIPIPPPPPPLHLTTEYELLLFTITIFRLLFIITHLFGDTTTLGALYCKQAAASILQRSGRDKDSMVGRRDKQLLPFFPSLSNIHLLSFYLFFVVLKKYPPLSGQKASIQTEKYLV